MIECLTIIIIADAIGFVATTATNEFIVRCDKYLPTPLKGDDCQPP